MIHLIYIEKCTVQGEAQLFCVYHLEQALHSHERGDHNLSRMSVSEDFLRRERGNQRCGELRVLPPLASPPCYFVQI